MECIPTRLIVGHDLGHAGRSRGRVQQEEIPHTEAARGDLAVRRSGVLGIRHSGGGGERRTVQRNLLQCVELARHHQVASQRQARVAHRSNDLDHVASLVLGPRDQPHGAGLAQQVLDLADAGARTDPNGYQTGRFGRDVRNVDTGPVREQHRDAFARRESQTDERGCQLTGARIVLTPCHVGRGGPVCGRVRVALTPHAPHTTSAPLLKALAGRAAASGSPLAVHVAESEMESAFLRGGADEFREFLSERGVWDDHWTSPGQSPIEYLDRLHVLSSRTLAVHCVHLGQRDVSRLQTRGVTVVTCPRSNERLGVGSTPVPKLLGAGIPVALGTDSLASSPDLDLFAEISTLVRLHPGISPLAALRIATVNGSVALGFEDRLGSIDPGKAAALIVVPLPGPGDDPLELLVDDPATVLTLENAPWEGQE